MPHYVFALSDIFVAAVLIFFSYKQFQKNNFRFAACLLVFAAFALRIYVASDLYLHEWDERYHALVAKNMMDNFLLPRLYPVPLLPFNLHDWSSNYIWLHKQPLPLWFMALSMKLFGVNEWVLRFPSVLVSSIAVYLTYVIGKKLFTEQTGLLAAFFHAINGLMIEMTGGRIATDHVDVFFFFFIELAVVFSIIFSERKKMYLNVLTGICIGLAVLCKWLPAFIAVIVWLGLNYNRAKLLDTIKGLMVVILFAFVVFMPWQIYVQSKFPTEYAAGMMLNYRHITEVLDGQGGGLFYFFEKLFITLNEFIWIAFAWFCYNFFQQDKSRNRFALIVWIIIPFIFFSVVQTKMQGYLLFVYPALFVVLSEFCFFILHAAENHTSLKFRKLIFAVILFLSVRYSIERIKPLQEQSKQLSWADEFRKMGKDNAEKKIYVNVKHCIEGMFYTKSIMYGYIPSQQQIDELKTKGYEVIINQNPEL